MIHIVKNINIIPFVRKNKDNSIIGKYPDLPDSVKDLDKESIERLYTIKDNIKRLYKVEVPISKLVDFINYQLLYSNFTSKLLVQSLKNNNVSTLTGKIQFFLNENSNEKIIDLYREENHLEIVYTEEEPTEVYFNVENIDKDTMKKIYDFQNLYENIKGERMPIPFILDFLENVMNKSNFGEGISNRSWNNMNLAFGERLKRFFCEVSEKNLIALCNTNLIINSVYADSKCRVRK